MEGRPWTLAEQTAEGPCRHDLVGYVYRNAWVSPDKSGRRVDFLSICAMRCGLRLHRLVLSCISGRVLMDII
jgi:hypothetical protein